MSLHRFGNSPGPVFHAIILVRSLLKLEIWSFESNSKTHSL